MKNSGWLMVALGAFLVGVVLPAMFFSMFFEDIGEPVPMALVQNISGRPITVVTQYGGQVLDPGDETYVYFVHATCGTFAARSNSGAVLASAELCDGDTWVVSVRGHATIHHND